MKTEKYDIDHHEMASKPTPPNDNNYGQHGTYGEPGANQVNVEDAKSEYESLKKELSRLSREDNPSKMEEGSDDISEFNLDSFLHGMSNQQDESGKKRKQLGVSWTNLHVEGLGADAYTIPTVASALINSIKFWKLFQKSKASKKVILQNLTGCCRDGEMLLVLGRPGAGCTTFLKTIANMRKSYTAVDGNVSYGGINYKEFGKRYKGQACYNPEEDQHFATLTTKQTLEFALRIKAPGKRINDESKRDYTDRIIYLLGNMLGLTKQMDTLVGNAFMPGLSGGERKRLSIGEQMSTNGSINCWDCSTRGLDAASALDHVRSLRIMTDIFRTTNIAALYQASNSIFDLFDKVLLLDEGYCIYYGPPKYAKQYFTDLGFFCPPRKSTADFLTGLCNPIERAFRSGFEQTAPKHASEFQERYLQSDIYKMMIEDAEQYKQDIEKQNVKSNFAEAIDQEHQKHANKNSPYMASFFQQVKVLTARQNLMLRKDAMVFVSRFGTILIQALITSSCFYKLPLTGTGAFSRGGALFFSVMFNSFVAQSELFRFFMGQPVLEKHKQYALYRPSAYYIAQVIMDFPIVLGQVLIFQIVAYFMMGLNLTAGRFFTYTVVLFFLSLCMNGLFRFFAVISPNFFAATQITSVLLVCLNTYTGYSIPYKKMHPWLSWIYHISPLSYGFRALISNEMKGQVYSCDGFGSAVPYGPTYGDWKYMVCTLQGGVSGENYVLGDNYLWEAMRYKTSDLWAPNFVLVVAFFLFFTIIAALAMDFVAADKTVTLTKLYIPGKAPKPSTIEEEDKRRAEQQKIIHDMESMGAGTTFSFQHINYTVPVKGGPLQILNDVAGIIKPGHLTALMGSSGAGKTTLLDVLARRKTVGKVEGDIFLNGEVLMNDFERITGYCEQTDIHQPAATVREALRFSAYLRQPASVSKEEKDAYVEDILTLLEMQDIADAQIGTIDSGYGISVEERKRLTIGVELVGKPQLLFLDEPTSGLDAQSSFNIIRFIRKLADAGWPILCTIHQPSSVLFEHFDHLLLLVRGGRTAYYGEIGPDSRTMIDYFESHGGPQCSPDANPAEYILEVVGAGTSGKAAQDWSQVWKQSDEAKQLAAELDEIDATADRNPTRTAHTYATPLSTQFRLVFSRMNLAYWRSTSYNIGRFINVMATSLVSGFTFWKLGNSSSDMTNKVFALFTTFIMGMGLIMQAQPKFMGEREFFRREYASRYYSWLPFGISTLLVEAPYIVVFSACFMFGFYWTTGMENTAQACGYFFITFVVVVYWAVSLGFTIAAVLEFPPVALILNPLFMSTLILFSGLMQSPKAMPKFWSSWMYWIDPFHYYIEGLAVNELANFKVVCTDDDLLRFTPPPGQTCGEYTSNYFAAGATGYISNPDAMQPEQCGYCKYKSGAEYYETGMEWSASHKWRNFGILVAFWWFNMAVFLLFVYLKRRGKR